MGPADALGGPPPISVPHGEAEALRDLGRAREAALRARGPRHVICNPWGGGTLCARPAGPPGAPPPSAGAATSSALPRLSPLALKHMAARSTPTRNGGRGVMATEVTVSPSVHKTDGPGTQKVARSQGTPEEPPPRSGATLVGVTSPTGILGPRVRPAPDGRQEGGSHATASSRSNRRLVLAPAFPLPQGQGKAG
jgi:hypothetical protein